MKKLIVSFVLFFQLTILLIAQQDHFTLTGLTNNIPDNTMIYLMDGKTNLRIDSVTSINNQFVFKGDAHPYNCLLYTSPSPRDATLSRMPSSA